MVDENVNVVKVVVDCETVDGSVQGDLEEEAFKGTVSFRTKIDKGFTIYMPCV